MLETLVPAIRQTLPTASFYVFIFVILVLIYIKLTKPKRLNQVVQSMRIEENKFDMTGSMKDLSISSILMQLSFVLLQSIGIWILIKSELNFIGFIHTFSLVGLIYVIQLVGFYFFSSIIENEYETFFRHRITHYELFTLIFLPLFAIITFAPYDFNYVIVLILVACALFSWIRSTIYLIRYISVFHIILYLCALELLPVLFLTKLVLTK